MNDLPTASQRVRSLREFLHVSQEEFAAKLGVTRSYVSQIENDRTPSDKVLNALRLMEVEARFGQPGAKELSGPRYAPVVAWADASALMSSDDVGLPERKIVTDCADSLAFGIVIGVDCMAPEFLPGETAIVMPCVDPRHNCLVIANLIRGGVVFRRWTLNDPKGASFRLTANKKEYRPIDLTNDDVHWVYPVFCVYNLTW